MVIVDDGGVDELTMRRLGQALGRNPMAIYRHAMDKDILLDGLVERVIAEFAVEQHLDVSGQLDWAAALRATAHRFRHAALQHPRIVPSLVTRSLSGPLALRPPGMLRPLEELLELFSGAGFDEHGALHAARLFTGYLYQHLLHEIQEHVDNPDETDDLLRLGLHRLPIAQFPRLRSLAGVLAAYDGAAELDEGLSIVIAGFRSQLRSAVEVISADVDDPHHAVVLVIEDVAVVHGAPGVRVEGDADDGAAAGGDVDHVLPHRVVEGEVRD
jgi:AcrR family transcriptional regulator